MSTAYDQPIIVLEFISSILDKIGNSRVKAIKAIADWEESKVEFLSITKLTDEEEEFLKNVSQMDLTEVINIVFQLDIKPKWHERVILNPKPKKDDSYEMIVCTGMNLRVGEIVVYMWIDRLTGASVDHIVRVLEINRGEDSYYVEYLEGNGRRVDVLEEKLFKFQGGREISYYNGEYFLRKRSRK